MYPKRITAEPHKGSVLVLNPGSRPLAYEKIKNKGHSSIAVIPHAYQVEVKSDSFVWIGLTCVTGSLASYQFWLKSDPNKRSSFQPNPTAAYKEALALVDKTKLNKKGSNGRLVIGVTYPPLQEEISQALGLSEEERNPPDPESVPKGRRVRNTMSRSLSAPVNRFTEEEEEEYSHLKEDGPRRIQSVPRMKRMNESAESPEDMKKTKMHKKYAEDVRTIGDDDDPFKEVEQKVADEEDLVNFAAKLTIFPKENPTPFYSMPSSMLPSMPRINLQTPQFMNQQQQAPSRRPAPLQHPRFSSAEFDDLSFLNAPTPTSSSATAFLHSTATTPTTTNMFAMPRPQQHQHHLQQQQQQQQYNQRFVNEALFYQQYHNNQEPDPHQQQRFVIRNEEEKTNWDDFPALEDLL